MTVTATLRRAAGRTARRLGLGPLRPAVEAAMAGQRWVLLYHRIATTGDDPWALAVRPAHFAQQLEVLRRFGTCLGFGDMARRLADGTVPRKAVAVTFDDGYADNLHTALPLLEKADVPATFFLAAGLLDPGREYWWDEVERILLSPGRLPATLTLPMPCGEVWRHELGPAAHLTEAQAEDARCWRAWDPPPTPRHALYLDLWRLIRPLPLPARERALADLAAWAGDSRAARPGHRPMSREEAAVLAASPLAEVGGHTLSHPTLPAHDPADREREIRHGRTACEEIAGRRVGSFAYPYGDCDPQTAGLVRDAGFDAACTTRPGRLRRAGDPFLLPRVTVGDWDGAEFERRLAEADFS